MRIALIADVFPPLRSSGAVQLRDLSLEFVRQGHHVSVLIATPGLQSGWSVEHWQGVEVVRLNAPKTKDVGYVRRTLGEFWMPFAMLSNLRKSPLAKRRWDGVVWYSPTIFLGPLANALKKGSDCKGYLIVRDIFPEWAVNMGLMGRGLPYRFFKVIENYQYSVANVIGVQTPGNAAYLDGWAKKRGHRVEVLQNWLAHAPDAGCTIKVADTALAGRKIFVYAGNMGIAQGMDMLLNMAEQLLARRDIGFLLVGRGSDAQRLRSEAQARGLGNMVFFDEIDPSEIPGLYAQCHVGLVMLDPRHTTHNIPGKFLTYLQAGLPVLASINPGNDLATLIESEKIGRSCTEAQTSGLCKLALDLVHEIDSDLQIGDRCKAVSDRLFSPIAAVKQIVEALR